MTVPYTLIESRQISGLGTIRVPSSPNNVGARVDLLIFDLIRPALNRYRNFDWFPPRERIANLTFRRSGIVLKSAVVEFERQGFWEYPDPGGQALAAVQCSYKGILQTFFNLGNALALPSISVQNDIKEWTRFETPFDEVVVSCYADTAISASLYQLDYEACGTDSGNFQFPENLPPAPAQSEPGEFVTVSPPYDPNNPNEPYAPNETDVTPPEPPDPPADACESFSTIVRITQTSGNVFNIPVSGLYPARVVATDSATVGETFIEASFCSDGVVTSLYGDRRSLNRSSSSVGQPEGRYVSVTCDDPNIPVDFTDFP